MSVHLSAPGNGSTCVIYGCKAAAAACSSSSWLQAFGAMGLGTWSVNCSLSMSWATQMLPDGQSHDTVQTCCETLQMLCALQSGGDSHIIRVIWH
eukprot:scaffold45238_cov19-Tisochrysis_lutea.AAC.1